MAPCKGSYKNYVDHFLPYFDHLPTSGWHFYLISLLSKVDIWRTTYLPRLVNVVFGWPLIAILRYPTFPYCFYYIAILEPSDFWEIFTRLLVISEWIYLGLWNFLRLSLTSVGICCWRNFWNQLHHFTTRGHQSVVVWAKNEAISCLAPPSGYICGLGNFSFNQKW